ncbi:MAG: hypothetical protein DHS20C11_24120 [Lysobacteraceae bacterium]|nr:MAG: hypothetical protein DHS20C11_24120 [Xanthomonadaceae bacterium]
MLASTLARPHTCFPGAKKELSTCQQRATAAEQKASVSSGAEHQLAVDKGSQLDLNRFFYDRAHLAASLGNCHDTDLVAAVDWYVQRKVLMAYQQTICTGQVLEDNKII